MKKRKLHYWVAICLNDSSAYNIRGRTRKEVKESQFYSADQYTSPKRVTVQFNDAFDLLVECLQEDGGHWEGTE